MICVSESPKSYYKKGMTSGNKRRRHLIPEINKRLYVLLMNQAPVRRCCEVLEINAQVYYDKVDWLYDQVQGFIQHREHKQ